MADLTGFGSLFDFLSGVVTRIWPDKTKAAEIQAEILKAQLAGELKDHEQLWNNATAQLDVNKTEAASGSIFVAGWRPFCGWVCGSAMAYNFVVLPFLKFGLVAGHWQGNIADIPTLDLSVMSTVLMGMLGLGAARTVERIKGVIPRGR